MKYTGMDLRVPAMFILVYVKYSWSFLRYVMLHLKKWCSHINLHKLHLSQESSQSLALVNIFPANDHLARVSIHIKIPLSIILVNTVDRY